MMTEAELLEIKDRLEIQELMYRYAEMVDKRDWKRMNRIFALEATIDYSSTGGHSGPFRETLAWLDRALESWPINLHIVTNLIIEFDKESNGDRASSRCYFHAPMARETLDGPVHHHQCGSLRGSTCARTERLADRRTHLPSNPDARGAARGLSNSRLSQAARLRPIATRRSKVASRDAPGYGVRDKDQNRA